MRIQGGASHSRSGTRAGLALVEWVVVLAVLGVGFSLVMPALQAAQLFAKRATCVRNLKEIALATLGYETYNGVFPNSRIDGVGHGVGQGLFIQVLPYLEQLSVYNAYNFRLEPWHIANGTVTRARINVYLCPDNQARVQPRKASEIPTLDGKELPGPNTFLPVHYGVNWGGGHEATGSDFLKTNGSYRGLIVPVGTAEANAKKVKNIRLADVVDGTSFTALVAEKHDGSAWTIGGWGGTEFDVHTSPLYDGDDAKARMALTGAVHQAGPNVAFGDGAVRAIRPTIRRELWYALMTRDGMEAIDLDELAP